MILIILDRNDMKGPCIVYAGLAPQQCPITNKNIIPTTINKILSAIKT